MKLPGELDELRVLVELSVASGTILPGLCAIVTASPFRAAILALVSLIPQGKCASYGQIASALQRFGAARAVGYAMRTNPIAPFVPCHRVVGGSGEMTGYQGKSGIPRKIAYLAGEGVPLIQTGSSGTGVSREAFISADELHGYARLSGALDIADISSIGQHESDGHANRFFLHSRWRRRIDS
ncbi:MAG: hypothetical protein CVV64_10880 [Candidatus Wallbacteria bacterium HGW-Wallbacteria-1]|uniref:Methylated-DNA-[protein]-cysteine S-methyltransferase DNA binding domain-containing protein n=1 Tax=Candidatus Wallbacteria bacterium HGW-Wallbacteria-1 TaxID=2013854 RepID=A0A2N1PPI6_9BACT|nr:MAG: hypothetical protein CVV64_10880 [Candidatus Wallbacteria bacterium HGW-Wallbacteria-1]